MEQITVLVVGAGPSGLAMGLALAKYKSIILEKESEINHDPRGVYLNGDAVRILWDLGLNSWDRIGHEPLAINFHRTSFKSRPFYVMDTSEDLLGQAVPNGFLHVQPKLEAALRTLVDESPFCTLRAGCTVLEREVMSNGANIVTYSDEKSNRQSVECNWLIGADGKKGVVRKHFLEPTAGIKQEESDYYRYEGTWVAANLRISPPTPETHPELPFWTLGMGPEDVYDLYWPKDWHFCTPPGKPTACGRFGPYADRLWRHEFAEPGWSEGMDAEALLWEHISPMITYDADRKGRKFEGGAVMFPRDCVEVLRCRPFTFTHKIVNQWFDERTVLVGDAAHVFPPFGGEGIASGIRDAHQLAWRIALAENVRADAAAVKNLITAWMSERRQGIRNAADFTRLNGTLCNEPESWGFWLFRNVEAVLKKTPVFRLLPHPRSVTEARGYRGLPDGFFLPEYHGGGKGAQIYVEHDAGEAYLSDRLAGRGDGLFTLIVLRPDQTQLALDTLQNADLPSGLLSPGLVISYGLTNDTQPDETARRSEKLIRPVFTNSARGMTMPNGYRPELYRARLKAETTSFAIVRPDFYIFALVTDASELAKALSKLRTMVLGEGSAAWEPLARL